MTEFISGIPNIPYLTIVLLDTHPSGLLNAFLSYPFIFGILAAMAHVLSGPDHLAAVGPLAVNVKIKSWLIGMSWGIGHLTGMLLIGILFYFFREIIPVDFISTNSEKIVGGMLILIGVWSLSRLYRYSYSKHHKHVHTHHTDEGETYVHVHSHDHEDATVHIHTHENRENHTYWAALGIGILHGLAGVSHFISLLPTLAFPSRFDSGMYLAGFGFGTIFAMMLFSIILGYLARKASKRKRDTLLKVITAVTGLSAIIVGIYWILNTM